MNNSKHAMRGLAWACGIAAAMAVAGCGGGSSSDDNGGNPTTPTSPTAFVLDSIVLPGSKAQAQAETQVQPLGVTLRSTRIALPQLDTTKSEQAGLGQPAMQIGVPRAVAQTTSVAKTQAALQWQPLPDGRTAAAVHIASEGAYGLRMGVLVDSLPDAAQLRIYSDEHPDAVVQVSGASVNALLAQNRKAGEGGQAASTWWTPDVGAGNATLEVVLPVGTGAEAVRIAIPSVSHIYQNLSLPTEAEMADVEKKAGACNLDASCTSNYQLERNAVARMTFVAADGISYLCTGTLVNNTKKDFTPYFLTANHCISTQTSASTLQTNWFYRSSSCNSGIPGTFASRNGGATLLYATASTDSSFLKLNDTPPAGVTLAGWDARNTAKEGTAIYGLHHPDGDLLKYSVGAINGYTNCVSAGGTSVSCPAGDAQSNFYSVRWSQGVTEGGSSGSGLFSNGRVIGTLYGGSSACNALNGTDNYGRFDKVFNSKIWSWLAG